MTAAIITHPTEDMPSAINSVESSFLRYMTDDEIRQGIVEAGTRYASEFPGVKVSEAASKDLRLALREGKADFAVEMGDLFTADGSKMPINKATTAVYPDGRRENIRAVGNDYGAIQTMTQLESLDVMVKRGELRIASVEKKRAGGEIKITATMGQTRFPSMDGAPNTLGHFAQFTINHEGRGNNTARIFSVRLECFNGMTSTRAIASHKIRHSKNAADRVGAMTTAILDMLIGDAVREAELLTSLVNVTMDRREYSSFVDELLGALPKDATSTQETNRAGVVTDLLAGWDSGNQGAGATLWGAYNSVTGLQAAKVKNADTPEAASRLFNGGLNGKAQTMAADAMDLLLEMVEIPVSA